MCLYVNKPKTAERKAKYKKGYVIRYKILVQDDGLKSPCVRHITNWKPGWVVSDRKDNTCDRPGEINQGIHVLTKLVECLNWFTLYEDRLIVKLKCYHKDLVGVDGAGEEVYTKVWLPKKEYDKALKNPNLVKDTYARSKSQ